jgi:hypothetical protein
MSNYSCDQPGEVDFSLQQSPSASILFCSSSQSACACDRLDRVGLSAFRVMDRVGRGAPIAADERGGRGEGGTFPSHLASLELQPRDPNFQREFGR